MKHWLSAIGAANAALLATVAASAQPAPPAPAPPPAPPAQEAPVAPPPAPPAAAPMAPAAAPMVPAAAPPVAAAEPVPPPPPLPGTVSTMPPVPPPPAPIFPAELPPAPAPSGVGNDGAPLAGWHGVFYVRSADDNFRLYLQGRAQIDWYNFFGPGVADTNLKSTLFLRRIRPELSGEFLKIFQWQISGDWGATGVTDFKGTSETSAANPGQPPTAATARYGSAQGTAIRGGPTDVYINVHACQCFNVQIGQFDAPFSIENRTSDKYIPFMERSLAVRALGIPTNKEVGTMAWGDSKGDFVHYAVGMFMGDGMNRTNVDNRFEVIGRAYLHPFAGERGAIKNTQIGGSFRWGQRDPSYVNYDYPAMTTQGGFAFWQPVYKGANGWTHVLPSGSQAAFAGELRIPLKTVDLTSELVYVNNHTREALEGYQSTNTERLGTMKGYSYYVELGWWPFGNAYINGMPGVETPTHVDLKTPYNEPKWALQLLAKWEQLHVTYDSASRAGTPDAKNIDGAIKVNALSFGANLWATKHVRFTANYVLDMFPGSAPVSPDNPSNPAQSSAQRAVAPANTLPKGNISPEARDTAHTLHEVLFRAAVAF